jgi:hypothetical protein
MRLSASDAPAAVNRRTVEPVNKVKILALYCVLSENKPKVIHLLYVTVKYAYIIPNE